MIIELQLQAAAFLTAQKAAFQARKLCPPMPITVGPLQLVIDRIDFGANSLRHNETTNFTVFRSDFGEIRGDSVPGFQTQLAQDVVVYVTSIDDIMAHPNASPSVLVPVAGTLVFDMNYYAIEQECYFHLQFRRFESGPLPPLPSSFGSIGINNVLQMANDRLAALFPSPAIPMGLLDLLPTKPAPSVPVNAGLTVDAQLQRLALRVEASLVDPYWRWKDFYDGILPERLGGHEWSLYLDGAYIALTIQTAIYQALSQAKSDGDLPSYVQFFPGAEYSNASGKAKVAATIEFGLTGPLPEWLLKLVVETNPTLDIPVEFSLADVTTLNNTIQIDVGVPDVREFVKHLLLPWAQVFLRFTGPVGGILSIIIDSKLSDIKNPDLPPELQRISPNTVRFTKGVSFPQIANGLSPRIMALLAMDDGIALAGLLNARAFTTAVLTISARPFKFGIPGFSCGSAGPELVAAFSQSPDAFDILSANIDVEYDGTLPVYLCGQTPINDNLGVFPANRIDADSPQAPATLTIHPPVPGPDYYAAPYPCDVVVQTTAGVRLVRIPPPPLLQQEDIIRLKALLLARLVDCEQLVRQGGYDPLWSVDPPDWENVLHLYEVEVNGLRDQEIVTLADATKQPLVTYRGRSGQAVKVSALMIPAIGSELTILHGRAVEQETSMPIIAADAATTVVCESKVGITVREQLLLRLGVIALGKPCQRLCRANLSGKTCVVAALEDGVTAFDLSNPQAPRRLAYWWKPGVRGAANWEDGLLFFGEEGLEFVDRDGAPRRTAALCAAEGIRDLATGEDQIYAASQEGIGVFSATLCHVRTLEMDHCRNLVHVGGKLIALEQKGLAIVDLTQPRRPRLCSTHSEWRLTQISAFPGTEANVFLAILEDGTARLLRVQGEGIEVAATFAQRPWFADALRIGGLMVRVGDGGHQLEIAWFGASALA